MLHKYWWGVRFTEYLLTKRHRLIIQMLDVFVVLFREANQNMEYSFYTTNFHKLAPMLLLGNSHLYANKSLGNDSEIKGVGSIQVAVIVPSLMASTSWEGGFNFCPEAVVRGGTCSFPVIKIYRTASLLCPTHCYAPTGCWSWFVVCSSCMYTHIACV